MSWLALIAILLQTLVPIFHEAPRAAAEMPFAQLAGSLCLAPGSMPPGNSEPGESDKIPVHKLPPCAICQAAQLLSAGFVPPSTPTILPPMEIGGEIVALPRTAVLLSTSVARPSARAPPLTI